MSLPAAATTERFSDRTRRLLTLINLHYAGVGVLAIVNLFLLTQVYLAWRAQSAQGADALAAQRLALSTAELQAKPLQGLDGKLATASVEADRFYERRLPYAHSQVLTELGALTTREHVKLAANQYAEAPVLAGDGGALTEVRMDANLSGDYRSLVQLVNALERDRMFFSDSRCDAERPAERDGRTSAAAHHLSAATRTGGDGGPGSRGRAVGG